MPLHKKKRGGGKPGEAAAAAGPAAAGAPGENMNFMAVDDPAMDILGGNDGAAPNNDGPVDMDVDAFQAPEVNAQNIQTKPILRCYPLNKNLAEKVTTMAEFNAFKKIFEILLAKVDYIHCKAFGVPTNIQIEVKEVGGGALPELHYVFQPVAPLSADYQTYKSSKLCLLCEKFSDEPKLNSNLILISIVTIWDAGSSSSSSAAAAAAAPVRNADIWSVAKNPYVIFPNAFGTFFQNLQEKYSTIQTFHLIVGRDNTITMSEQGRLRLYSSLGFRMIPGQQVRLIYPKEAFPLRVTNHKDNIRGLVVLQDDTTKKHICSFLGNIQSHDRPIVMGATRKDTSTIHDIYLGLSNSFKGTHALLYTPDSALMEVAGKITDNNRVRPPLEELTSALPIKALYHMGLPNYKSKTYPTNTFLQTTDVPDDFLIFTVTSPGSFLFAWGDTINSFIQNFMKIINTNPGARFQQLLENNRSTQRLPIINLLSHDSYVNAFTTPIDSDTQEESAKKCKKQLFASFLASKLMEQLGRQPIFQFTREVPANAQAGQKVYKKFQLDTQLYVPGMKIFNYNMMRNTNASDIANKVGTYTIDQRTNPYTFTQYEGDVDYTDKEGTLKNYLNLIRTNIPKKPEEKYFLFLFGCAGVNTPNYDLLYELSHRRSSRFNIPPHITFDNPAFIEQCIFNKNTLSEHDCGDGQTAETLQIRLDGGGRKSFSRHSRMATRFRKVHTRKMKRSKALKTRKQKGGNKLTELLGLTRKTTPLTSQANNTTSLNRIPTAGRTASKEAFIENRKRAEKLKEKVKAMRNMINSLRKKSENHRSKVLATMSPNDKARIEWLVSYPNFESLTDDQVVEYFKTGKIRSLSI